MLLQASMMWGDEKGNIKRQIDSKSSDMKEECRRFHFLIFDR